MMALILAVSACLPVDGDQILMRDLAAAVTAFAGQDPEEALGFTPAPGSQRRFSAGELDRLAARKGIAAEMEPVCFERKLEALTQEQILAGLREALPEKAQIELIDFSHARVPKGPLEFARSGLTPARASSPRDAVIWRGRVRYSAASSVPVWARVRVWISRPAAMAAQDLPAGKPIQADQIRMENVDGAPFGDSVPMALQDVAGMAPRPHGIRRTGDITRCPGGVKRRGARRDGGDRGACRSCVFEIRSAGRGIGPGGGFHPGT